MSKRIILFFILTYNLCYSQDYYSLSYNDFIARVTEHSKDIKISNNEIQLAQTQKQKALAQFLPQVGAEAGYKRYIEPEYVFMEFADFSQFQINPETGEVDLPQNWQKFKASLNNTFSAGAVLNQTLFSLKALYDIATAKEYQQLIAQKQQLVLQEVLLESSKAFYGTLLLQQVHQVNKDGYNDAGDNYKNVELNHSNGLVSRFDYLQAKISFQNARIELQKSARILYEAKNNLKLLCGINLVDSIALLPDNTEPIFTEINVILPENNLSFILADTKTHVLEKDILSKKAVYYPSLKGQIGYTYYTINDAFRLDENINNFPHASLTLNIPILSGGYNRALAKEAKIKLQNAQIERDYLLKEINQKIINCRLTIAETQQNINTATETVNMAFEAYQLAKSNAAKGLISQLDLNASKLTYKKSQLGLSEAQYMHRCNILEYQKLNGKLIESF